MHSTHKPQARGRTSAGLRALLAAGLVPALLAGGCESMSHTDRGILTGGGLGAVAGALVGGATGHAGAGAAIGAGLGGVAGGVTGAAIDRSERRQEARLAAATAQRPPLSLQDIVQLTASGSSDALIIDQIRATGSTYQLSGQDTLYLQTNGVREPVIREMLATAYRAPRHVYTAAPVQVVQPVYVVEPPPPPVGVGFGFTYRGGGCRRW